MRLAKKIVLLLFVGLVFVLAPPQNANAQIFGGVTAYYAPQPVVSYYAPQTTTYYAPAPVTTYYAPAPVKTYYAPAPVTTYYAPAPAATYYAPTYYYRPGLLGRIFGY